MFFIIIIVFLAVLSSLKSPTLNNTIRTFDQLIFHGISYISTSNFSSLAGHIPCAKTSYTKLQEKKNLPSVNI